MLLPLSPMTTSNGTAPEASFAIASSAESYVAICDLRAVLLLELLDEPRVDVVGVVVDLERPTLRATPSASIGLSSVIAQVTPLSVRGSGSPPGPTGFATTRLEVPPFPPALAPSPLPPASVPVSSQKPIGVVVFWHATSAPATPVPAAAAAAPAEADGV